MSITKGKFLVFTLNYQDSQNSVLHQMELPLSWTYLSQNVCCHVTIEHLKYRLEHKNDRNFTLNVIKVINVYWIDQFNYVSTVVWFKMLKAYIKLFYCCLYPRTRGHSCSNYVCQSIYKLTLTANKKSDLLS